MAYFKRAEFWHRTGKQFKTTLPDEAALRPPDLVGRDFRAARPNAL